MYNTAFGSGCLLSRDMRTTHFVNFNIRCWPVFVWTMATAAHWRTTLYVRESWRHRGHTLADANARWTRGGWHHISTNWLDFGTFIVFNVVLSARGTGDWRSCWNCWNCHRCFSLFTTLTSTRRSSRTVTIRLIPMDVLTHEANTAAGRWWPAPVHRGTVWWCLINRCTIHRRWTACWWQMLHCVIWVDLTQRYNGRVVVFVAVHSHNRLLQKVANIPSLTIFNKASYMKVLVSKNWMQYQHTALPKNNFQKFTEFCNIWNASWF